MASLNDIAPTSGSSRASYVDRMKDIYLPQLNNFWAAYDDEILGLIGKNKGNALKGKRSVTVAGMSLSVGAGARGQTQRLPTATATSSIELEIHPRKYEARLGFTPEVLLDARGGDSSFQDAYSHEMESLEDFMTMDRNDKANIGRSGILGRHAGAPTSGGVVTLQPGTGRGASSTTYFDRGMMDNTQGTQASHPFYVGRRLSFVASGQGAMGSPYTGTTAPSGDRAVTGAGSTGGGSNTGGYSGGTSDNDPRDEITISALNGSDPAAPTMTLQQNATALPGSAAAFIALTGINGAFVIPYASRYHAMTGTAANDITFFYGGEGIQSYLSNPNYAYSAILGQNKTAAAGLQAYYAANPASAGTNRVFSDAIMGLAQRVIGQRTNGKRPKVALCTWAGWDRVAAEHENAKRIEAVIGNGGTTAWGSTPDGYTYIGGGGQIGFKPAFMAMPKQMALLDPADWEYMESQPFQLLDPNGHFRPGDYDLSEYSFMARGNIVCSHIMGQGILDDLTEDPFAVAA